jgi:protein-disulfide isomerase
VAVEDRAAAGEEKQANILRGEGEATRKKLVMAADGALQQKLDAYVATQAAWAGAFAERAVPSTVFGGGAAGTDSDVSAFMQLMTVNAAKELGLNPNPTK